MWFFKGLTLGPWLVALGPRSQDVLDAWSLKLDPRAEFLPGSGHDVQL